MRTTINIDEHVLARAKDDARAAGITLGQHIERALRNPTPSHDAEALPPLPTIGGGRLLVPIDRMSNAEIQDFLDENVPLDQMR